jgi:DNA-directed RNA polymerase subunit M/transcription elongation factor TFIIS
MDAKEEMQYIKENDYDFCPECNNRNGNTINLASENPENEGVVTFACAKCGLRWNNDIPQE